MDIISLIEKEIRAWWLTGGKLEEILTLCPQGPEVREFVTSEYVSLERTMKSNPFVRHFNSEGPIRGRLN